MSEKAPSEVSREIRLLYQKGSDALTRDNLDYAIDLFNQVLEKEPALYDCRKALRSAQAKKSGGGGAGGFFKKMLSNAGSSPLIAKGRMALGKNPAEALHIAEQILNHDPNSAPGHRLVADAAMALELPRTAMMSLEVILKNSPGDKSAAIEYANALAEIGEPTRAERVLVEFSRSSPNDPELVQALKNISARKTLDEGGYESLADGKGSYRDILKDEKQSVSLEQEQRVQKTEDVAERLIGEYEIRLKTEPANLKLLRSLAELYTQKKQYQRALDCYQRVKDTEAGSSDPTLDRAIADTIVRRYEHQIEQLDKDSPSYAEDAAKLTTEKLTFQITECQKRVEKFPTDLAIRYEMGALYFHAGKISEAILEFQKSQGNPHKRIASMNYLAQCFGKRKMFDLAARTFLSAIKEKMILDDEKKELIYNLGCVFESMGKKEEAVEQFKQIYEVDIGYRDVAAKVDAYYAGQ